MPMSKPRFDWWPYVKGMIRRYPALLAEWEDLAVPSITPNYDAVGHGSGISKPTEQAALRQLRGIKQKELESVQKALDITAQLPNGTERLKMIELVFWKRTHNLDGAALQLHYSWRTVAGWHRDFIRQTAKFFGLLE